MSRTNFLFGLIIILAIMLRFFYLGRIPNGFYSDEASYGYNAYSILKTGKDEYGAFFPLAFKSFGEYKAPLYIYLMVPFVWIFGLSEFSVRVVSALLGVLLIALVYLLVRRITHRSGLALATSFIISVSPLALQFNRMGHENNLSIVLIAAGIMFFIYSLRFPNYILLSLAVFALSLYNHNDVRVLIPLLLGALFLLYRRNLLTIKKQLFLGLTLFIVLLIPLFGLINSEAFWNRPKYVSFFSDKGIVLEINKERGEDNKIKFFNPYIFHNKVLALPKKFLENYFSHFNFDFMFLKGDQVQIYNTIGNGLVYLFELPFILLGLYFLLKGKNADKWIIIILLIISPIPGALTRYVPSASRTITILLPLSIVSAYGLLSSIRKLNGFRVKKVYLILISIIFSFNMVYYLHYYYFNTPLRYAKEWHYGMREVVNQVEKMQNNYSNIWFSKNTWGYIYPLFYLQYPPDKYQTQAKLSPLNEFGFGWIDAFDKYIFADFPDKMNSYQNTLFIGSPMDFKKLKKPLYSVYYPNGDPAFYLADGSSF